LIAMDNPPDAIDFLVELEFALESVSIIRWAYLGRWNDSSDISEIDKKFLMWWIHRKIERNERNAILNSLRIDQSSISYDEGGKRPCFSTVLNDKFRELGIELPGRPRTFYKLYRKDLCERFRNMTFPDDETLAELAVFVLSEMKVNPKFKKLSSPGRRQRGCRKCGLCGHPEKTNHLCTKDVVENVLECARRLGVRTMPADEIKRILRRFHRRNRTV